MLILESNLHTYKTQCSSSIPAEGKVKKNDFISSEFKYIVNLMYCESH